MWDNVFYQPIAGYTSPQAHVHCKCPHNAPAPQCLPRTAPDHHRKVIVRRAALFFVGCIWTSNYRAFTCNSPRRLKHEQTTVPRPAKLRSIESIADCSPAHRICLYDFLRMCC